MFKVQINLPWTSGSYPPSRDAIQKIQKMGCNAQVVNGRGLQAGDFMTIEVKGDTDRLVEVLKQYALTPA